MIVVSDTSPLSNLLAVNRLDILPGLYAEVIIPNEVAVELLRMKERRNQVNKLLASDWLTVKQISDYDLFQSLRLKLDRGESEAITLAIELGANLIVIDEIKGRRIAKSMGLNVTGLLGILVEAKQKNIFGSVKEIIDDLRSIAGFRVSKDLYELILNSVGEL